MDSNKYKLEVKIINADVLTDLENEVNIFLSIISMNNIHSIKFTESNEFWTVYITHKVKIESRSYKV